MSQKTKIKCLVLRGPRSSRHSSAAVSVMATEFWDAKGVFVLDVNQTSISILKKLSGSFSFNNRMYAYDDYTAHDGESWASIC